MKVLLYVLLDHFPHLRRLNSFVLNKFIDEANENAKANGLMDYSNRMRYICFSFAMMDPDSGELPAVRIDSSQKVAVAVEKFSKLLKFSSNAFEELHSTYLGPSNRVRWMPIDNATAHMKIAEAITFANSIDPAEVLFENPYSEISLAVSTGKPVPKEWIEAYDPTYYPFPPNPPFYPLETAIKAGNLQVVKELFAHLVKLNPDFRRQMRESKNMEVEGRPIYWLAGICNPKNVKGENEDYKNRIAIEIMDFLEKELQVQPGHTLQTNSSNLTKSQYIELFCADSAKKLAMVEYCKQQVATYDHKQVQKVDPPDLKTEWQFWQSPPAADSATQQQNNLDDKSKNERRPTSDGKR